LMAYYQLIDKKREAFLNELDANKVKFMKAVERGNI